MQSSEPSEEASQQNSILTDAQREFLRLSSEERREEYSKQMISYHRQKVFERVRTALLDFTILTNQLGPDDWQEIFTWVGDGEDEYQTGVRDMVAFAFLSQSSQSVPPDETIEQGIRDGVQREVGPGYTVHTDLDIEVTRRSLAPEDILDKVDDSGVGSLTGTESEIFLDLCQRSGLIDISAIREQANSR